MFFDWLGILSNFKKYVIRHLKPEKKLLTKLNIFIQLSGWDLDLKRLLPYPGYNRRSRSKSSPRTTKKFANFCRKSENLERQRSSNRLKDPSLPAEASKIFENLFSGWWRRRPNILRIAISPRELFWIWVERFRRGRPTLRNGKRPSSTPTPTRDASLCLGTKKQGEMRVGG